MNKAYIFLLIFSSLWLPAHSEELADCPQSIAEAIERLDETLPEEEKTKLKKMTKEDLISLHFGFGMGLRNGFCLWNKTGLTEEMENILVTHPDDMSGELIKIYWSTLNDIDFNLETYLKEKRKNAIETMTNDLRDIRKRIKELEEEKAQLADVAAHIEELLNQNQNQSR